MGSFRSLNELTNTLQQGAKLLNDMFQKRKSISIRYDDALETLDGNETKLNKLIDFGIIARSGDSLELEDVYQRFFEEVLSVNEEINVASVKTFIDSLRLKINSYLAAESASRKAGFLRDIKHIFRNINSATRRNVIDLKRNVDDTYKQEPNFKIKELRLRDFDQKRKDISSLIHETEKLIEKEDIFFSSAMDTSLRETLDDVRAGLNDSDHFLIEISGQIIDYLNRIEYQNKIVKKVRQVKFLRDQFMIEEGTDIRSLLSSIDDVWMESRPKYMTKVSLDFLQNADAAIDILDNIRHRLKRKANIQQRLASPISGDYLSMGQETTEMVDHQAVFHAFKAQSDNLFSFVWNLKLRSDLSTELRLVLFLQIASQYGNNLNFTAETAVTDNIEYPLIYP